MRVVQALATPTTDPWRMDVMVVHDHSHSETERSSLHRDAVRGLLLRLAHGAYVERSAFQSLKPEDQHVVRMRAVAAGSDVPVVFSHWSAAVLHGLPVLHDRLRAVHVTVARPGSRSRRGIAWHVFGLEQQEIVGFGALRATGVGRTVLDTAGAAPFEEGVITADGALRAGVPRELLLAAIDVAGPRRAVSRIRDVVSFAHPGAESAAESRLRVTMMRLGHEIPLLQFRIPLAGGSAAFIDEYLPQQRIGIEVDGDRKYLDPEMATEGAARAVLAEKRREDEVRTHLAGLARVGWYQAGNPVLLDGVLARVGVRPLRRRMTRADYAAAALSARPRTRLPYTSWRA